MYPAVLSIVFEQFVENQLFRRFYYVGIFPILHKSVRYKPSKNWSSEKLRKGKCMKKGQQALQRKKDYEIEMVIHPPVTETIKKCENKIIISYYKEFLIMKYSTKLSDTVHVILQQQDIK